MSLARSLAHGAALSAITGLALVTTAWTSPARINEKPRARVFQTVRTADSGWRAAACAGLEGDCVRDAALYHAPGDAPNAYYALDGDPIETLARAFLMRLNDPAIRALFRIIAVEGDRFPDIRKVFDTHTRRRAHHAAIALFERLANERQFEPGAAELASRQLMGMLEHETIILPLLEGQDYAARHDEQMARDATRTLRARFAAIPGRVDAPTVAHPDRKTR
ncbi:TetR/AcrR family transcriptional regulator C-terminal domain-containing protein [Caulobacter segnis]